MEAEAELVSAYSTSRPLSSISMQCIVHYHNYNHTIISYFLCSFFFSFCLHFFLSAVCSAVQDVRDVGYEESLLRDPYSVKQWLNYLEYKHDAPPQQRILLYERALHHIPGSYKLWYKYLLERMERTRHMPISDGEYEAVNNVFERALVYMHKMPRIWKEYTDFLIRQRHITRSRRTFDKALMSLAVTQHLKWIWPHYLTFARDCGVPETAIRIYRRYLKLEPLEMENYIKFLKKVGRYEEAAQQLAKIVNDDSFQSQRGKSKHDLWTELLQMITKNPTKVGTLDVDAVIRSGIRRFPSEVGRLWVSLADYYIRMGYFEKARDVYEEGINTVSTVRDFTQIFDAYSKFEETMLQAKMKEVQEKENEAAGEEEDGQQQAKHGGELEEIAGDDIDIDMRFIRLEDLANRRPFLLSSVLLRQNPHNVEEWLKRVELYAGDIPKQLLTFTEAVTTVDPHKATGKIQDLWVAFARFYEKHKDLENARTVFDKATQVNYKTVDQLIYIWCEYVEMELRHKKYKRALQVIKRATVIPKGIYSGADVLKNERLSCQQKIHKSTKLWSLYADLEENFGTLETTKAVYEQMIFLKIVTPNIIINYANLMEEHKYFEDSFRVYEKGIDIFEYPHVLPIWMCYLKRFIHRYGGKKIERTRDLFEQALEKIPAKDSKRINLLYAKFEEDYGLAKRAMDIYDRAVTVAPPSDRYEMFLIYIARCAARFGITKTRDIYEKAIKNLPDAFLKSMCLKYAALEKKLGEVDRARAIYNYGAQFAGKLSEILIRPPAFLAFVYSFYNAIVLIDVLCCFFFVVFVCLFFCRSSCRVDILEIVVGF